MQNETWHHLDLITMDFPWKTSRCHFISLYNPNIYASMSTVPSYIFQSPMPFSLMYPYTGAIRPCAPYRPHMAASVCCSLVLFLFLFVCPVLSNDFPISFTRNKLLDIRNSTPDNLLPTFEHSDVLLDILFGGAASYTSAPGDASEGSIAGALVKSRQRGLRIPLPSIHPGESPLLANKSDELQLLTRTNKDFLNSAALCFTETWLNGAIPDSARISLFRIHSDRQSHRIVGEKREAVDYVFISMKAGVQTWQFLKKMCCPNLEALFINCKPFYSPQEFSSFILVSVYIPPDARVSAALVGRPNTHRAALPGLFHCNSQWF